MKALLILIAAAIAGSLFFRYFPIHKTDNVAVKETEKPESAIKRTIELEGLIKSVSFNENCEIRVTSTNGKEYLIGELAGIGMTDQRCISANANYAISDSGKYLVFEDVAGGLDLWVRVFSAQTKSLDTLGVWGTSSLLSLKFLPDDKLAILNGYPDIPEEQWLHIYNLPFLYSKYPESIDEYNYINPILLDKNSVYLPIEPVSGDYFKLSIDSKNENLVLYGGTKTKPVVRGTFPLRTL